MPVFTNLNARVDAAPFDKAAYDRQLPACSDVARQMPLVHVTGKGRTLVDTVANRASIIPTSDDAEYYTDDTRRVEDLLGLPRSAYFYAGRACPEFGNVAMTFAPDCEATHEGCATPFDTGGLMHTKHHIKVRLTPIDGDAERVQYGRSSEIPLDRWREVFAQVLAAYFQPLTDYWHGRPQPFDLEGLYELNHESDYVWRAWTFEVRFHEPQSTHERTAWCADETVMESLRRLQEQEELPVPGDPPSALSQFLDEVPALEPAGTPHFCTRIEQWVRQQVGL